MALFTKCILGEKSQRDGIRISVMNRHMLNDGITRDLRIKEDLYDLHLKLLGPSSNLLGDYYKRGLPWKEFKILYLKEIRKEPKFLFVKTLAKIALKVDITIMCIEDDPEFCHRRLLAEECKKYEPRLKIKHR